MKSEIIPVIHFLSTEQVMRNINICQKLGVRKFFLIGHLVSDDEVLKISNFIKQLYPDLWIGVNLLRTDLETRINMNIYPLNSIWFDETPLVRKNYDVEIFSEIDFKFQKKSYNLESDCISAMKYCDVLCTSGERTGKAPTITKIERIRSFISDFPLAIASGVSIENAKSFSEMVDYLMVASSITDYKTEIIDESKLESLLNSII